ncbi:hypothetical protein ACFLY2_00690 [Patescibacteria group bacterium]
MIDFLVGLDKMQDEEKSALNLNNESLLIEFRDNILEFQANYSSTNIVEFFSHFIEQT